MKARKFSLKSPVSRAPSRNSREHEPVNHISAIVVPVVRNLDIQLSPFCPDNKLPQKSWEWQDNCASLGILSFVTAMMTTLKLFPEISSLSSSCPLHCLLRFKKGMENTSYFLYSIFLYRIFPIFYRNRILPIPIFPIF